MSQRGQSSVEYVMLLTVIVFFTQLTAHFLSRYVPLLLDRLLNSLLQTALSLALPY